MLQRDLSGERAQAHVRELGRFYRSPGSVGYRSAIDYIERTLDADGVGYAIREFPMDGHFAVGDETTPLAWEPYGAQLDLVVPSSEVLVRWDQCGSCLPWWCPPTPKGGTELELVDVGTGTSDADYAGKSVRGKAILVHDSGENFAWSDIVARAVRHGVAGMVSNFLLYQYEPWRTRSKLPEAVQQMRLPARRENPLCFTVSETAFSRLESALAGSESVVVRFSVEARTFESSSRSVLATIPSATPTSESVLFVAHVSAATMPGANCASGVALLLELARCLDSFRKDSGGTVFRRNVHLLFANEGYGSLELADAGGPELLEGMIAAVALCSVGHDQSETKSVLVVGRSPDAFPTFLNDLVEALADETVGQLPWAYRPRTGDLPYVRWKVMPYTPWSDNSTWSRLGVPGMLVMSLPDRYFHTQLLTPEKTDPYVFVRSGSVLGTAALVAATAGWPEAGNLMRLVAARSASRMDSLALRALDEGSGSAANRAREAISYVVERDVASLRSVLELVAEPDEEAAEVLATRLETELRAAAARLVNDLPGVPTPDEGTSGPLVGRRPDAEAPHRVPGFDYAGMLGVVARMREKDSNVVPESLQLIVDGIWYWTQSPIDLASLTRAINYEFGFALGPEHVLTLLKGLESQGYVTLSDAST